MLGWVLPWYVLWVLPLAALSSSRRLRRVALALLREAPTARTLLSLNFPKGWDGRVRATRLGTRIYEERVEFRNHGGCRKTFAVRL